MLKRLYYSLGELFFPYFASLERKRRVSNEIAELALQEAVETQRKFVRSCDLLHDGINEGFRTAQFLRERIQTLEEENDELRADLQAVEVAREDLLTDIAQMHADAAKRTGELEHQEN